MMKEFRLCVTQISNLFRVREPVVYTDRYKNLLPELQSERPEMGFEVYTSGVEKISDENFGVDKALGVGRAMWRGLGRIWSANNRFRKTRIYLFLPGIVIYSSDTLL